MTIFWIWWLFLQYLLFKVLIFLFSYRWCVHGKKGLRLWYRMLRVLSKSGVINDKALLTGLIVLFLNIIIAVCSGGILYCWHWSLDKECNWCLFFLNGTLFLLERFWGSHGLDFWWLCGNTILFSLQDSRNYHVAFYFCCCTWCD